MSSSRLFCPYMSPASLSIPGACVPCANGFAVAWDGAYTEPAGGIAAICKWSGAVPMLICTTSNSFRQCKRSLVHYNILQLVTTLTALPIIVHMTRTASNPEDDKPCKWCWRCQSHLMRIFSAEAHHEQWYNCSYPAHKPYKHEKEDPWPDFVPAFREIAFSCITCI